MMQDKLVIGTKLLPPRARNNLLPRKRLLKIVQADIHRKLILISAAVGYGKTKLLTQFFNATDYMVVWYDLDKNDSDFAIFFTHLIEGLREHYRDIYLNTLLKIADYYYKTSEIL